MKWSKVKIASVLGSGATAVLLACAAAVPEIAGIIFLILGKVFLLMGMAFGGLSAWFFKASDEKYEKAIWGIILLVMIVAGAALAGIQLMKYWEIFLIIGLVVVAGVLWGLYRQVERRR